MPLPSAAEIETARREIEAYFAHAAAVVNLQPYRELLPATKTSPRSSIAWVPNDPVGAISGSLVIFTARSRTEYVLTEFIADSGRGIHFAKVNEAGEGYDVFICDPRVSDAGMGWDSCDCRGFESHGHCKHLEAVRAIVANQFLWHHEPASDASPAAVVALPAMPVVPPLPVPAAKPAKPIALCTACKSRPRQRDVYLCFECESRM